MLYLHKTSLDKSWELLGFDVCSPGHWRRVSILDTWLGVFTGFYGEFGFDPSRLILLTSLLGSIIAL
jgi:hypothetical protein